MARTTSALVIGIMGDDYGPRENGVSPDLTPYIDTANALISRVNTCALTKNITLSTTELELLERWMAAHYYTKSDPTYNSRTTEGASGNFVRDPNEPEPYKNAAIDLDPSGCLNSLLKRQRAGGAWMGKTAAEAVNWQDRN